MKNFIFKEGKLYNYIHRTSDNTSGVLRIDKILNNWGVVEYTLLLCSYTRTPGKFVANSCKWFEYYIFEEI